MTHEDRRFQELERSQQRQDKRAHLRYLEDEYYDDLDASTGDEAETPGIARLMADVDGSGAPAVIDVPPSGATVARTPLAEALRVVRTGGSGRAGGEPAE